MIRSMTAFARQESEIPAGVLSWELRTVNHRYLEISLRLPEEVRAIEGGFRDLIGTRIKRGKVDAVLRFQAVADVKSGLALDRELISLLIRASQEVEAMLSNPAPVRALDVLRWPGVLSVATPDTGQLQAEALALLDKCLKELHDNRFREGEKIKELITQRCAVMVIHLDQVRQRLPEIMENQRKKYQQRIEELRHELNTDRLDQEMAYIAQKIDVEEELDRISVHVDEIQRVLEQEEPVGRRLDFLMQELNREANTLGSKSVDSETTRASVEMKVLIEQMREQIQNIE